jgi:plasmid maintenance system killer protein
MRIVLFTASDTTNIDPLGLSLELTGDDKDVVFSCRVNGNLTYHFRHNAAELVHQINLVADGGTVDNR